MACSWQYARPERPLACWSMMTFFHCSMLCCVLICWIRFKARPPPKPGAWFSTFFVLRFLCFQQTHYLTWEVEIKYTVLFDGYTVFPHIDMILGNEFLRFL